MARLFIVILFFVCSCVGAFTKPKVIVLTDINVGKGDPDDRQSLIHLLWYSDVLDIEAIVPDRWKEGRGLEACEIGLSAYEKDYVRYRWHDKGFMDPDVIRDRLAPNTSVAIQRIKAIVDAAVEPIYVLVWGNMKTLEACLLAHPEIASKIRVISIGTGLKYGPKDEVPGEDCNVPNWNGPGRNTIFKDERFKDMWWLEINWTYNGMFMGDGPTEMFEKLSHYGSMGKNIKDVTKGHDWAQYFRVGDTPSVLYVIDQDHNINDPTFSSWAGKFKKPFPIERPNYFTDDNGAIVWNYQDPCKTWENLEAMYAYNKQTLLERREEMYEALLAKLQYLYAE